MLRVLVPALLVAGSTAVFLAGCGNSSMGTMNGVVVADNPGTGGGSGGCFLPNWPGPGQFSPDISTLQVVVAAPNGTVLGTGTLGQPSIKPLPGSQTGYEQCFYSFRVSGLPSPAMGFSSVPAIWGRSGSISQGSAMWSSTGETDTRRAR